MLLTSVYAVLGDRLKFTTVCGYDLSVPEQVLPTFYQQAPITLNMRLQCVRSGIRLFSKFFKFCLQFMEGIFNRCYSQALTSTPLSTPPTQPGACTGCLRKLIYGASQYVLSSDTNSTSPAINRRLKCQLTCLFVLPSRSL